MPIAGYLSGMTTPKPKGIEDWINSPSPDAELESEPAITNGTPPRSRRESPSSTRARAFRSRKSEGFSPRMRVILSPRADRRLEETETYIAERNPRAAIRIVNRIIDIAERLADDPRSGRDWDGRTRAIFVSGSTYRVHYRIDEAAGVVEVITVAGYLKKNVGAGSGWSAAPLIVAVDRSSAAGGPPEHAPSSENSLRSAPRSNPPLPHHPHRPPAPARRVNQASSPLQRTFFGAIGAIGACQPGRVQPVVATLPA